MCARVGGRWERAEPVAACDQRSVPRAGSEGEPQAGRIFWFGIRFSFSFGVEGGEGKSSLGLAQFSSEMAERASFLPSFSQQWLVCSSFLSRWRRRSGSDR